MTHADEVREMVTGTGANDWIPFADMGIWTAREDVQLRLVRHNQLDPNFVAPWTERIQGGCQSYSYVLYYGNSPVEYHVIVGVDDFRAHVPMPQEPTGPNGAYTITPYQAVLGRIVTRDDQTFDAYLNRAGIEVGAPGEGQAGGHTR